MSLCLVSAVGLVGLVGVAAVQADDKALAAEMKKLEGTWAPTENILNGAPTPEQILKPRRTVVTGDAYENRFEGKVENKGAWKFVAKKDKVLHIDLYPVDGPGSCKLVSVNSPLEARRVSPAPSSGTSGWSPSPR